MVTTFRNDTAGVGETGAARVLFFDAVVGLWSNATAAAEQDLLAEHPTQTWLAVSAFLLLYAFWTSRDVHDPAVQQQRLLIATATVGGIALSADWAMADPLETADALTTVTLVTFAAFVVHRAIGRGPWRASRRAVAHIATVTLAALAAITLLTEPTPVPDDTVDASAPSSPESVPAPDPIEVHFPADDACDHDIGEGDAEGISPAQQLALQLAAASTDDTTCGRLPAQDLGDGVVIQFVNSGLLIAHEDGRGHPIWQRHIFGLLLVSPNLDIDELGGIPDAEIPCGDGDLVLFTDAVHRVVAISLRPRHFTPFGDPRPQIPLPPSAFAAFIAHVDAHGWSWPVELVRSGDDWTIVLENGDRVPASAESIAVEVDDVKSRCPAPTLTEATDTQTEVAPAAALPGAVEQGGSAETDSTGATASETVVARAVDEAIDDALPSDTTDEQSASTSQLTTQVDVEIDIDVTIELPPPTENDSTTTTSTAP